MISLNYLFEANRIARELLKKPAEKGVVAKQIKAPLTNMGEKLHTMSQIKQSKQESDTK